MHRVVLGAVLFSGAVALVALSGQLDARFAVACLVVSAIVAAGAEMLDSAA